MSGAAAAVVTDLAGLLAPSATPLQAIGPDAITDTWWPVRALATFVVVAGLGGLLVSRYEPFVDRSIDASMDQPLSSFGHGVAAHAVIAFAAVYLADKFGRFGVLDGNGPMVGLLVGVLLALAAGTIGFTVVGSTIVELRGDRRHELGLMVGALIASSAVAVATTTGAFLWFVVVSIGIGGAVRKWLHASAVPEV